MTYISRRLDYFDSDGRQQVVDEVALATWDGPVIVLGEPGMGKTELLKALALNDDKFVYVTAKALLRTQTPISDGNVLVIDGLDELPAAQEHDPIVDVLTKLIELGHPSFFLSCRAADWRNVAAQEISGDYGQTPVELRLAPFTEEDACAFLSAKHGPERARETVDQLRKRGLDEFYGNPLALDLIGRLAARPHGLPSSRADLYRLASEDLRCEQNPDRPRSKLAALASDAALNAAGAACAALLLTGGEAIGVGAQGSLMPGDLHVSEIAVLPGAGMIGTVVSSMLFRRREGVDRIAPFHRALAEYLGARWLARQIPNSSAKRLLALLLFQGGVPASLRGLHAWLAHFSPQVASLVIATDPYGVLRYGDAVHLTPTAARELLHALEQLSQIDPWFRAEDWTRHTAPGLTQASMAEELRRVLLSPNGNFHLKSLILVALRKSEAAEILAPDLTEILWRSESMPDGKVKEAEHAPTFHERSEAFDILCDLRPRDSWTELVETFLLRPGEDDRRLAVEAIETVGCEYFDPELIARAALAYLGLLPGKNSDRSMVDTIGPLHLLSHRILDSQVAAVLDAVVALSPATKGIAWDYRYQLVGFIDHLIARALALGDIAPVRLLHWLRIVHDRQGYELEDRRTIYRRLADDASLRRAIQHYFILVEQNSNTPEELVWRVAEQHPGLVLQPGDIEALLAAPELAQLDDLNTRAIWKRLLAHGNTTTGLPAPLRALANSRAADDQDLREFISAIDRRFVPDWRRREKISKWRSAAIRRKRHEKSRQFYLASVDKIRSGDWGVLSEPARAYLNHFSDLNREVPPRERLEGWLGEALTNATFDGFRALLAREDGRSAADIAETYGSGYQPRIVIPLLAAACKIVDGGEALVEFTDDVILAIAVAGQHEQVAEDVGGKALKNTLEAWFDARPGMFERFARLLIEPQLRFRREHVTGLQALMRAKRADGLVTRLAAEWLQNQDDIQRSAEAELLDHLSRQGEWGVLKSLLARREVLGYRDIQHQLLWRAVAFFADFNDYRAKLELEARANPDLFWTIRNRGWPVDEVGKAPTVSLQQLAWFIRIFRHIFKNVERPTGIHDGDSNDWNATEFLKWIIRRIAADISEEAVCIISTLRDEQDDGYRPFIQNACAQQLKARREAGFKSPALSQLVTVLAKQGPVGASDLQAIVLDALDIAQARMNRDDVNQVAMFYEGGTPKKEEECRDSLVILLRDNVGHGIDAVPERLMPRGKRADIVFACKDLRLPIEAKGQWHAELWTAASEQLDAFYTIEWRAKGVGVYVVFWFGPDVPNGKKLRSPGRGIPRPTTAEELKEALKDRLPEHRRDEIAIVVLDVGRPAAPSADRAAKNS